MPTTLYHYTCTHVRARLGKKGRLTPHPQPALGGVRLVWLTDMEAPDRDALGLTSRILSCDRTAVRYHALPERAVPWATWRAVHKIPADVAAALEAGRAPERWWVSDLPVRVRLAPRP